MLLSALARLRDLTIDFCWAGCSPELVNNRWWANAKPCSTSATFLSTRGLLTKEYLECGITQNKMLSMLSNRVCGWAAPCLYATEEKEQSCCDSYRADRSPCVRLTYPEDQIQVAYNLMSRLHTGGCVDGERSRPWARGLCSARA